MAMFANRMQSLLAAPAMQTQQPETPKPSFFGEGGTGRNIAGFVGDALLQANGARPIYAPMMQQRQQLKQRQMEMQQRMYGPQSVGGSLVRLNPQTNQVETLYQAPKTPHYWETNDGSLAAIGPDGQPQVLYKDPTPKINWITADNGDGTKSVIPVGPNGPVATQASAPRPQIGATMADPRKAGGPTQPASGGFRR